MKRLTLCVLILAALFGSPLAAQNETVEPEIPADVAASLTPEEASALERGAEQGAEAVAAGESNAAEVGRDPAKATDMGESSAGSALALLFTAVVAPIVTEYLKRRKIVGPAASSINLLIAVLINLAAWYFLHTKYPSMPQDPFAAILIGLGGGGGGQAVRSALTNSAAIATNVRSFLEALGIGEKKKAKRGVR